MNRWLLRSLIVTTLLLLSAAAGLAAPSKLDPLARFAMTSLQEGKAPDDIRKAGVLSVTPAGELDVFIRGNVTREQLEAAGARVRTALPGVFTAWIPLNRVDAVAGLASVERIEGAAIAEVNNDLGSASTNATIFRGPGPAFAGLNGAGVIVGNVDTGVDYHHDNFKDAGGNSRILKIWDQTNGAGPAPAGFAYGTEWNQASFNSLASTAKDTFGHGSHTMGTAAGDGSAVGTAGSAPAFTYAGMAPMADIIAVDASVSGSFSTTGVLDGINYIMQQATAFGKNAVVNVSVGGQFGPKDGTSSFETAVDALCGPGKMVVFSAGNDRGLPIHAEWVNGNPPITMGISGTSTSATNVQLNGYYEATEQMNVTITTPNSTVVGPITLGGNSTTATANGSVHIENGFTLTATGDKQVFISLSGTNLAMAGTWTITLTPVIIGAANCELDLWRTFSSVSNCVFLAGNQPGEELINALATGYNTLAAGAWVTRQNWTDCRAANWNDPPNATAGQPGIGNIANFSSPGPTRDGRFKPDVSAPGAEIISVRSGDTALGACTGPNFSLPGQAHIVNQGTSMSAPFVTGAVALLFAKYGALTPSQVQTLIHARALSDGFVTAFGAVPNKDFGWGKLNIGDMTDPFCTVTAPNGGESFTIGSSANLTWSASDPYVGVTGVDLELSRNNGGSWETIALNTANTGTYAWTVTGPGTVNALFRATAHDASSNAGVDVSNAVWSITDPTGVVAAQFRAEPVNDGIRLVWEFPDPSVFSRVAVERAGASIGPWGAVTPEMSLEGTATVALDRSVEAGHTYFYRLSTLDHNGTAATYGPLSATAGRPIVAYDLEGISPNPTRGQAVIEYSVPRASDVSLASGRQPMGRFQVTWSGETDGGPAPAGVYFVRLRGPDVTKTRRIVVSH
jgi:subtilisin family serine protease